MNWLRTFGPAAALLALGALPLANDGSNGQRFDPDPSRMKRSARAPEALDQAAFLLGRFRVERLQYGSDAPRATLGQAWITWMNRGHSLQWNTHFPGDGPGGEARETLGFLATAAGSGVWSLGEVDGLDECVRMYQGGFEDGALVLHDARRRQGGVVLTSYRRTCTSGEGGFTVLLEDSSDLGKTWNRLEEQRYSPLGEADPYPFEGEGFGEPDESLPQEAREFDFLIGVFDAAQAFFNPGAPPVRFGSRSTAVYVLGGRGILEYGSYDVDPSFPEAATSIVRVYNRAMRRWESLYLANRGNTNLHFGGVREDDAMVLTNFGTHRGDPISHFVFHDLSFDSYAWYCERSSDGGRTFQKTWTIDFERLE